ncbi:MAG TPA: methyltransferase [Runella sp.]|nr:methyltransferase [Runella sp.]
MQPQLSPSAQLMQMVFGFIPARAISLAAELGIADLLKDGAKSVQELSVATDSHSRSLYRLLRVCASVGVFSENENNQFANTVLSDLLRSDSPESLKDFSIMIGDNTQFKTWGRFDYAVKTGQPAFDEVFGMPYFDFIGINPKEAKTFNDAMTGMSIGSSMAVLDAYDFSGINMLVDVGGGHGFLLASILNKYPDMQGINFDVPALKADAEALFAQHGVSNRSHFDSGDFFQTVTTGGDAYIMKHIIHDWNDQQCIAILSNCRKGIKKGGKVLLVEMVLPDGNEPSMGKLLDLQMLSVLPGCERTRAEYADLLEKSGFALTQIVPTLSPYSVIEGVAV